MPDTRPFIPRILIAFDFDRTLATDSVDAVLSIYGIERDDWENEFEEALGDGWDDIVRRGQALIDLGRARDDPLTIDKLREAGGRVSLYDDATRMPDRLREAARSIHPSIEIEFVVLSSGYAEIIEASGIMAAFDGLLASTLHFGPEGRAVCVKRAVTHPQKALYLEALGKGLDYEGSNGPERAGDRVDEHDMHCPFDQMIYLGDGASDLQAFGFLTDAGGVAIAVDPDRDDSLGAGDEQAPRQRVDDLAPPDYSEGAELMEALGNAVRAAAHRIALRARSTGE